MHKFKSLEIFRIDNRWVCVVENPEECEDFKHILGHDVEIDGKIKHVTAVERFAHCAPWWKGEKIGLMIK